MSMNNDTLEGQLREMYGRVAYTHKTHEKMADKSINKYKRIKTVEITLSALSAGSFIFDVFGDTQNTAIIGACLSTILLGFILYFKEAKLGEASQKHTVTASKLWGIREKILSAIVDLRRTSDAELATRMRDDINAELEIIYKSAPRTDSVAYMAAQDALKNQEELFFSDEELDHLLPKQLRITRK